MSLAVFWKQLRLRVTSELIATKCNWPEVSSYTDTPTLASFTCGLLQYQCVTGIHLHAPTMKLKLKLIYDRQSVDQFVWVSGLPMGPLTRFYLTLLSSADNYLIILSKAPSLTRKRVCSLQWNHPLVPITILYCLI
jgi:hypothetical protein